MNTPKTNLYNLSRAEMEQFITALSEPKFRAKQVWHWLYRSLVMSVDEMRNLPAAFRTKLAEVATIGTTTEVAEIHSSDGYTQKWLLDLPDHEKIEAVLMNMIRATLLAFRCRWGVPMPAPSAPPGAWG
jgi:23S rRNA (adenine2503-C2)-methyltransferase